MAIFAITRNYEITCRMCDFKQTTSPEVSPLSHFMSHLHLLPALLDLSQAATFFSSTLHFCLTCDLTFPTMESHFLHEFRAGHEGNTPIYCAVCKKFVKGAALLDHMVFQHPYGQCFLCKLILPWLSLLEHMLDPHVHPSYPLELFHPTQHSLINDSRTTHGFLTVSQEEQTTLLLSPSTRSLNAAMLGFRAFKTLQNAPVPDTFPKSLTRLITDKINTTFNAATNIIPLIQALDHNADLYKHKEAFKHYSYELSQLQLYRRLEYLLTYTSNYPTDERNNMFSSNTMTPEEVLSPPIHFPDSSILENIDFTRVAVIVVGSRHLRPFGTHMSSKLHILNLSCPTGLFLHPTSTFKDNGTFRYSGIIKSNQWGNLPVLSHNSFFNHLQKVAKSLKHSTPVVVEFDISGFVIAICGTRVKPSLDDEVSQYVQGYFIHFRNLLNSLPQGNVFERNYTVVGQLPYKISHLSTLDNLKFLKATDVLAANLAAIFRIRYLPCYYLVGLGVSEVSTIIPEPGSLSFLSFR